MLPTTLGDMAPPLDADALRARLAAAEASLSQTRRELSTARHTIAARDAAPPEHQRAKPPGRGNQGGLGADGGAPPGSIPPVVAAAPNVEVEGEATGGTTAFLLPTALDGSTPADYAAVTDLDHGSDGSNECRGFLQGTRPGPRGGARFAGYADTYGYTEGYNDSFDRVVSPATDDWLQAFAIPGAILRSDGIPVPFSLDDRAHYATFTTGSRDT